MFLAPFRRLTPLQRRAFGACFWGWTLDAFDFFILTYCLDSVAATFHVDIKTAAEAFFWTLCMRPVGALLFGYLAERYGRRRTLMTVILCFSLFEIASAFAPTFGIFLFTRALFGIAMGGEWGVGAALAFETLPSEGRGFFSGLLQEGYVCGNLLAAAAYGLIFPLLHGHGFLVNWRLFFLIGALPALLAFYIGSRVEESPAWKTRKLEAAPQPGQPKPMNIAGAILHNLPAFLLLTLMMTAFMSFSHGTQDLYPTFLKHDHGLTPRTTSWVAIVGSIGALLGGICCGTLSERFGRRRVMVTAALCSIPMIPLWAWSHAAAMLALGGFLMQFCVQGAWGVIPVHLNELSPAPVRAIFPGLAYQLGNLLSSKNGPFQAELADRFYHGHLTPVLAWTVLVIAIAVALLTGFGRESKGADLSTV
ncbi:MFS transporter [Granulicella sp. 5B5]|nr:MFS transporter [Granulicella sp. 5B5]